MRVCARRDSPDEHRAPRGEAGETALDRHGLTAAGVDPIARPRDHRVHPGSVAAAGEDANAGGPLVNFIERNTNDSEVNSEPSKPDWYDRPMAQPSRKSTEFADERQERIAEHVSVHGRARIGELAELFGVTEPTIRKDLSALQQRGLLKRTHGGALAVHARSTASSPAGRPPTAPTRRRSPAPASTC